MSCRRWYYESLLSSEGVSLICRRCKIFVTCFYCWVACDSILVVQFGRCH